MGKRPRSATATARARARGLVLDAGAFVALEARREHVVKLLAHLVRAKVPLVTSGGVVAQFWRGGSGRQAPVAALMPRVEVVAIDHFAGRLVGMMLGASRARDAVDGHVVLLARERSWPVLTSDAADLRAIDPGIEILVA